MGYIKIPERLRRHRILINNGINDPVIADRMATVGYTPEAMQEAQGVLQSAEEATEANKTEQGEYREAMDARQEAKSSFHEEYLRHLDFVRIALEDQPALMQKIDASGARARTQAEYLAQAKNFYNSIATDTTVQAAVSIFGITPEVATTQLAAIENLYTLMEQAEREEGDAQHQIKVRDQKLDEFEDWANRYKKVARLMFANEPQYLEKLGIIVKS